MQLAHELPPELGNAAHDQCGELWLRDRLLPKINDLKELGRNLVKIANMSNKQTSKTILSRSKLCICLDFLLLTLLLTSQYIVKGPGEDLRREMK